MPTPDSLKTILPLLKHQSSGIVAFFAFLFLLAKLPPEQFQQLCTLIPYFNTPFGLLLVGFGLLLVVISVLLHAGKPIFNEYMEKEREHVKAMQQVSTAISDIKQGFSEAISDLKTYQSQLHTQTILLQEVHDRVTRYPPPSA